LFPSIKVEYVVSYNLLQIRSSLIDVFCKKIDLHTDSEKTLNKLAFDFYSF